MRTTFIDQVLRAHAMYEKYEALLREGMPKMDIYVVLEDLFGLEERQIRRTLKLYQAFREKWTLSSTDVTLLVPQPANTTQTANGITFYTQSSTQSNLALRDECPHAVCHCPHGQCSKRGMLKTPSSNSGSSDTDDSDRNRMRTLFVSPFDCPMMRMENILENKPFNQTCA